jgi:hypothetical protein
MEELFNLTYKDEVDSIKDEPNYEEIGDSRYINHPDFEARLYWAFCRPSGSHPDQLKDKEPLVSIMAFNHSRLPALQRFSLVHKDVIVCDDLRKKIKNRARMLFRDLADNDFSELNSVLDIAPVYLDVAIDQLINGRKWNDIVAKESEATKLIDRAKQKNLDTQEFYEAIYAKLVDVSELDERELKEFLVSIAHMSGIDTKILEYYKSQAMINIEDSNIHILQKKGLENLVKKVKTDV